MGFFSDMGFFEKIAFTVLSPVILPAAVAVAAYEKVTEGKPFFDSETPTDQSEQEVRERIEREAKEKQAEEERQAITSYATNGLIELQKMHSIISQSAPMSFSFKQLQNAIQNNQESIQILTHLIPNASGSDTAPAAQQKAYFLNEEIQNLKELRQAITDIKTSKVNI